MKNILIMDDDQSLCRSLQLIMKTKGVTIRSTHTAEAGLAQLNKEPPNLLLLDLVLPDADGLELLQIIVEKYPDLPVVVISGRQDMDATITAMRHGAYDYLRKPFDVVDIELILEKLRREQHPKKKTKTPSTSSAPIGPREMIGNDPKMLDVLKQIGRFSRTRINVLIHGENGTGKELVARAIHEATSPDKPFIAINCSALVSTLLESELFGHEKGAFTGADQQKIGKLELAAEGTVFFDEIGDMDADLQAKLLRVLQEQTFERVGGNQPLFFNARSIFATHQNLTEHIREKKFREDLFYRIAVGEINLPPLRERPDDIPLLAHHFIRSIGKKLNRNTNTISAEALKRLKAHAWPGNIRELENVITRAIALTDSNIILPEHINFLHTAAVENTSDTHDQTLASAEKKHLQHILKIHNANITHAAKALHISPTTLRKKIKDYAL